MVFRASPIAKVKARAIKAATGNWIMKIVKILKLSIMISAMILKMMSTTINIMKETNIMMESEGIKYSKRWKIEKNQCNWQTN